MKKTTIRVLEDQFWITNISNKNVSLRDLALTVPGVKNGNPRHMNLLDSRHFHYTAEQLEESATSGSLFAKSNLIKIRKVVPMVKVKPGLYVLNEPRNTPLRSQVVIVEKKLEDLVNDDEALMSDQKFAMEFIEEDDSNLNIPKK